MAQCIAYELGSLGADISMIAFSATSSDRIPNTTSTGGSGTSETCAQAAVLACQVHTPSDTDVAVCVVALLAVASVASRDRC